MCFSAWYSSIKKRRGEKAFDSRMSRVEEPIKESKKKRIVKYS
jgi:hypothetical protein